MNFLSFFFLFY